MYAPTSLTLAQVLRISETSDLFEEEVADFLEHFAIPYNSHSRKFQAELAWANGWRPGWRPLR